MYSNQLFRIFILVLPLLSYSFCSENSGCKCENTDDYEPLCTCTEKNNVVLEIMRGKDETLIDCKSDDIDTSWPLLFEDVNITLHSNSVRILTCPVPSKSYRWILDTLSAKPTRLFISNIRRSSINFTSEHFENLEFLKWLKIDESEIETLPEKMFENLNNLTLLVLRNNAIESIPDDVFDPLIECTFLDISDNNLSSVGVTSFRNMAKLKTLLMRKNKLNNLSREVFRPLIKLVVLDLSFNGISQLPEDVFYDLKSLEKLDLDSNLLLTLPEVIFKYNKFMTTLKLSNNRNSLNIPSKLFFNSSSLKVVEMEGSNLSELPENLFWNCINLTRVQLNNNLFVNLPGRIFKNSKNIEEINLSKNKLSSLNDTMFEGLRNLNKVSLQGNKLSSLNSVVFRDLKNVKEIYLQNNNLSFIDPNAFKNLEILEEINLNHNRLSMNEGHDYSFLHYCKKLEKVFLKNNEFEDIPSEFVSYVHLKELNLSYNRLKSLDISRFQFIAANSQVVYVDLRYNQITSINLSNYENVVRSACVTDPCRYFNIRISLAGNHLSCDCRSYDFWRLVNHRMSINTMQYFTIEDANSLSCAFPKDLNSTLLSEVPKHSIMDSHKIVETLLNSSNQSCPNNCTCSRRCFDDLLIINCSRTNTIPAVLPKTHHKIELLLENNHLNIGNLKSISRFSTANIIRLSLAHNDIENIDDLQFPLTLQVLELNDNKLTNLNERNIQSLNRLNNLSSLALYNNSWKCDCGIEDFVKFIQSNRVQITNINGLRCQGSDVLLTKFNASDLCKLPLLYFLGAISLFCIVFGVTLVLYMRYNKEIKIWLYAHKLLLCLVAEKEIDRHKRYDGFVTFAQQDEDFVIKHLLPGLEKGSPRYKLCVHYRDWLIGDYIHEQIIRSVNDSRRTIVILTPHFLQSDWCKAEFDTAHAGEMKEHRRRIIVILLKELGPNDRVPEGLKTYLRTQTYLKWGDPWFWEKLRYAMPHPCQPSQSKKKKVQEVIYNSCNGMKSDFTSDEEIKAQQKLKSLVKE